MANFHLEELWNVYSKHEAKQAVDIIRDKGGAHLDSAIALGGMFLAIMAENGYTDPKEVWLNSLKHSRVEDETTN